MSDLTTYVDPPLGASSRGRLTIVKGRAQPGYVLAWNGSEWIAVPPVVVTAAKTMAYTASFGELVICDPTTAGFTVTLPAASVGIGQPVIIKNASASANTITISRAGSDLIDGASSASIAAAWASLTLVARAGGWVVV